MASSEVNRNRDIVRVQLDMMNKGDWKGATNYWEIDARNHGRPVGREGLLMVLEDIYRTFPDWKMEVVELVGEGDLVAARLKVSGTHRGVGQIPINGGMLVGVEPTGNHFEVQHIHWYRLKDGKIIDHYANRDDIGMMVQLGLLKR